MFGTPRIRKGQPDTHVEKELFLSRFKERFFDPRFNSFTAEIQKLGEVAWQNYEDARKAPQTVKAGEGFADPEYNLSIEWLATHRRLLQAQAEWKNSKSKILIVNGSPRSEHTCPGEMSKSYRLAKIAAEACTANGCEVEILDLSRLTSEYGRTIHPCKACVSTAMPLCHWPCSCYPNHSLGQSQDWMNEIYEKWVSAHGILIVTPVHWYQAPSVLKLMIDRLVCADGGNPDPTTTHGKNALEAKKLELKGWNYPKHLAGRAFGLVVHGDAAGAGSVRDHLTKWLKDIQLIEAGNDGTLEHYIGYYKPYATSHDDLDDASDFLKEVENVAVSVVHQVRILRDGHCPQPDAGLKSHLQK